MQVVVQTDYQDIYRIKDGVLLVVNKFEYVDDQPLYTCDAKTGKYHTNCQQWLKILKKDFYDKYENKTYPKGTIMYYDWVVESTDDKDKWIYQIKTTGESFSGNSDEMMLMLNEIVSVIEE